MRFFRYLGVALICLMLVVVGLVVAVRYVDIDSYKEFIAGRIESATGREVTIKGDMSLDATLSPIVVANDVSLSNVANSDEPQMVEIERLEASVNLMPLLRGVFEVNRVYLRGTRVVLEKDAQGKPNWQFREKKSEGSSLMPKLDVRNILVEDIEVVYSPNPDRTVTSTIDSGKFAMASVESEVVLDVAGDVNNIPVSIKGQLEGLWGMIIGQAGEVDVVITAEGLTETGTVSLKGEVPAPNTDGLVDLDLEIDNFDPGVISAFAPVELSQIGPIAGTARLSGPLEDPDLENLNLESNSSDLKVRVNGNARGLLRKRELDIVFDVPRALPARLLPALAKQIPAGSLFEGSGRVRGSWPDYRAESVGANLQIDSTVVELNGSIDDLMKFHGVDLGMTLDAESLATLGAFANKTLPQFGPIAGTGRLKGNQGALRIEDLFVDVSDPKFRGFVQGKIDNVNGPTGVDVDLSVETTELSALTEIFNGPELGDGRFIFSAKVTDEKAKWIARDVKGRVVSDLIELDFDGAVTDLASSRDIAMGFSASLASLSDLNTITGKSLPPIENVRAVGVLSGKPETMDLNLEELTVDDPRLAVRATGRIENILGERDTDIEFEASAAEVRNLGELVDAEIPAMGPVSAQGRIRGESDLYRIEGLDAELGTGPMRAKAVGSIADLVKLEGLDLELDVSAEKVSALPVQIDQLPGDLGPLGFKAHVGGSMKTLRLENFNADLVGDGGVRFDASGDLANVWEPTNLSVRVNVAADSLTHLSRIAGRELPDVGPLNLVANIDGAANRWSVQDLKGTIADEGRFLLSVDGAVQDLKSLAGVKLKFNLDAESAKEVAAIFKLPVEFEKRLELEGEVSQSEDTIYINDLVAILGESGVNGNLELAGFVSDESEKKTRPKITGQLISDNIDLQALFPPPERKWGEPEPEKDPDARIFSTDPLPLVWMEGVDADVALDIKRFRSNKVFARDIKTKFKLAGKHLTLDPINARLYDGNATIALTIDAASSPALVRLRVDADGIDPGTVSVLRDDSPIESGLADVSLDITGHGHSLAGILSTAQGSVLVDMKDVRLSNTTLETIGADATLNILRTINPLLKKETSLELGCGIAQGKIKDGQLKIENTLATQSKRVAVVGSGLIDFKTEQIDFAVTPRPRKGLGLGAANFAQVVRIGGRLAAPKVEADPAGFLKSGAKIGAALYTGGLSVLAEGLFNRLQATDNVCDAVRRTVNQREIGSPGDDSIAPVDSAIKK